MTDYAALLTKITERFNTLELPSTIALDELTLEVPAANLISVARALRDEPAFQFNLLLDVCGVDYLHYGLSEWQTTSATGSGFERGRDCSDLLKSNESNSQHAPDMQQLENQLLDAAKYVEKTQLRHANPIDLPNKLNAEAIDVEMPAGFTPELDEDSAQLDHEPAPNKKHPARFAVVYHLLSLPLNQRIRLRVYASEDNLHVPSVCELWPAANWFEREAFDLFGIIFDDHPDLRRILTDYGFIGHPFRKDFPLIGNVEVRYDAGLQRVIYEPVNISPRILEPKVIRKDNRYETGE